jgi:hypothetical protein
MPWLPTAAGIRNVIAGHGFSRISIIAKTVPELLFAGLF